MVRQGGTPATEAPTQAMLQLIAGGWASRTIFVAVKLGIPEELKDTAKSSEELAQATGAHAPSLLRLLRTLTALRVLAEEGDGCFRLTPLGATLRRDAPGSLCAWAEFALGEEAYRSWGSLLHSIQTGGIAFENEYQMSVWQHRAENSGHARLFDRAMSSISEVLNRAVLTSYPFSEISLLVDVGGGDASFLIMLLRANPDMRGILFDLPHVAEKAKERIDEAGLGSRCTVVAGSALESVPEGGDAYVLSRVIHDWADAEAIRILANCRSAMHQHARLILIERALPTSAEGAYALQFLSDLNMMVMNGGRERTEDEFRKLFQAAGLRLIRAMATPSPMSLIEAAPV